MSGSGSNLSDGAREASFDTVLEAERASEEALRASRAAANHIRQAATAQERRIAKRTDERLQNLHSANQRHIASTEKELIDSFEGERQSLAAAPDPAAVTGAAERLARKLTGIDPP